MQRTSFVFLIAAVPVLWLCLGESSGARFVNEEPWPTLQKEADVIVIVSVTATNDLPKDDAKEKQAQESRLRVLTVLKGQGLPPQLQLLHYRYKAVDEGGSPVRFNSCPYLNLKTTPEKKDRPEARGFDIDLRDMPAREGQYLMFLTRQADGRMVPVTGHCDPANSIFALTPAETDR